MLKKIEMITYARNNLVAMIDGMTVEQVNDIPNGFNNNLIWHLGHVVAVQQGLCYVRSSNAPLIDMTVIEKYKNGTKPEQFINEDEIIFLKNISVSTLEQLQKDIADGVFDAYEMFKLSNGIEIGSIDDVLTMLAFHEGNHLGYAQALKRAIKE